MKSYNNFEMECGINAIRVYRRSDGSIDLERLGEPFSTMYTPEYLESCVVLNLYGKEEIRFIQDGDILVKVLPKNCTPH